MANQAIHQKYSRPQQSIADSNSFTIRPTLILLTKLVSHLFQYVLKFVYEEGRFITIILTSTHNQTKWHTKHT